MMRDGPLRRVLKGQTSGKCPYYLPRDQPLPREKEGKLDWINIPSDTWLIVSGGCGQERIIDAADSEREAMKKAEAHIGSTTPLGDFGDRYVYLFRHDRTLVKYPERLPWLKDGRVSRQKIFALPDKTNYT